MDAVFFAGTRLGVAVPDWYPARSIENHLAHCLLSDPHDFAAHSRRINFWLDRHNPTALSAALVDLFLVLGTEEPAWRHALLTMTEAQVPAAITGFLRAPHGELPVELPDSLFAHGCAFPGGPDFSPHANAVSRDPGDQK